MPNIATRLFCKDTTIFAISNNSASEKGNLPAPGLPFATPPFGRSRADAVPLLHHQSYDNYSTVVRYSIEKVRSNGRKKTGYPTAEGRGKTGLGPNRAIGSFYAKKNWGIRRLWATGSQWLAAVGCCLWDDGDKEQVPRGRGYAAVVGGAAPHYPEYAVGGVDQQQLALLVEERILVVGEVVAY